MQCPRCQHLNTETAKFCEECGNRLVRACPACGHEVGPTAKFCAECGEPLLRQPQVPLPRQSKVPSPKSQVENGSDFTPQTLDPSGLRTSDVGPRTFPQSSGLRTSDAGLRTPPQPAERILVEQTALGVRGSVEGERKTITALFADIKGSMNLIEDVDPEEARLIIDPVLTLMMDAVHRYEGYVVQPTGDGIFALFGAPIAHEDHPQRALYAALRMQEESKRHAERLRQERGLNLQIRVGINTGEMVLRSIPTDDLHAEYAPVGHSTSLASRMENLATPGSIVVSEYTYKLTDGYFEFKSLGPARVKGVSEPINIYEVLGVGPLRTRLQVSARRGLVRFVGRQNELGQMRQALAQAKEGHGQIVAVVGEPGVGKSRLCYEFKLVSQSDCLVLETFSVSHGKAYPYLPLIDLLRNYFQVTLQDNERRRREKVMGKVLALDQGLADTLPYLFALLGIAKSASSLQEVDPQIKRQRAFQAVKRLLVRESLNQPLILLFEDLQWLDAETQAFLLLLSESVATSRIVLLVNYRPEYRHEWNNRAYYTQLRLHPLEQEDAQEVLSTLLAQKTGTTAGPLLQPLKQLILAKTEGNPFFMEEIVRALFEQGVLVCDPGGVFLTKAVTDIQIPPTVQGVLAARVDRLRGEEKQLLQTLAVIGREFPFSLLQRVATAPDEQLRGVLSRLQAEEFIYEQPAFPEPEYTFKHALTQEVAYSSLLLEQRRGLHERTAQGIEDVFRDQLEDHYSELAHHYSHSGNREKAVHYLQMAGQQAMQHSAYADAIGHLTTALELLATLPDTPARARQELALQIALGTPLVITKGYGVPEVAEVYTRARELYQQVGNTPELLPILFSLWRFYFVRGAYQVAHELAEQFTRQAQSVQDPALRLPAHLMPGLTLFRLGEFAAARTHLEQGSALYDSEKRRVDGSSAFVYSQDPGTMCLAYAAWVLGHLGYMDQALRRGQQALSLAHELAQPFSIAFASQFLASVHRFRREGRAAQELAEATIVLAREQGFPYWVAAGTFVRGLALVEQGQKEEGVTQIQQGIDAWKAMGIERLGQPSVLLAEAYGQVGQTETGLALLAQALSEAQESGEQWWTAELYRIKGQLVLQSQVPSPKSQVEGTLQGRVGNAHHHVNIAEAETVDSAHPTVETKAEHCFLKAIEIAQRQQAKSLELRAVMSLSRLWQSQGKKTEARQKLAETYGWFTEGFDTKDLQEAKALMEELSH